MTGHDEDLRKEAFGLALELERSVPRLAKGMADYMAAAGTLSLLACVGLMNMQHTQGPVFLHRIGQAAFAFGGSTSTAVGLMFGNWFSAIGRRELWLKASGHLPRSGLHPFADRLLHTWHWACASSFTLAACVAFGAFYGGGSIILFEALVKAKTL